MNYDLELHFESGNQSLVDSLMENMRKHDGCLDVKLWQSGTHNKIVSTYQTEEQAKQHQAEVNASSVSLFPKFKTIIEERGFSLL